MYDVIIVGGGVSGTTLAFELSKYEGSVLLLEKEKVDGEEFAAIFAD